MKARLWRYYTDALRCVDSILFFLHPKFDNLGGLSYLARLIRLKLWVQSWQEFIDFLDEEIVDMHDMREFLTNLTKGRGRVFGSFEGSAPSVIVAEPDLLRDILVKDFHIFPYRNEMKTGDAIADKMVTSVIGEDWKRIRTIITPAFTSKRMRQISSIMNDCSHTLLEVCEKYSNKGEPVDVKGKAAVCPVISHLAVLRAKRMKGSFSDQQSCLSWTRIASRGFRSYSFVQLG
ncbi:lithocholate 6-beta-hydroxylase [Trichonephila clavipes]|nr:lithocholate 6-beta-hydroxylase [Trichonephila clavipes]